MSTYFTQKKIIFITGLLLLLFISTSCNVLPSQGEEASLPAPTVSVTESVPTEAPTEPPTAEFDAVSFSFGPDIAGSWSVEFVPQGPGSTTSAGPVEHTDPEHIIFSLDNYVVPAPSPNSLRQPKIYIYPAVQMSEQNPVAASRIAALRTFLDSPPPNLMDQSVEIPFLPLFNAAQIFHTQVKFTDFQNGKGVRFLTGYSQGPMPIVNAGIFYTFQGLTNDGAYYVAVLMPVNHPSLKTYAEEVMDTEGDAFMTDPVNYVNGISEQLDRQASYTFTPDLAALDAMIQTLLVRP